MIEAILPQGVTAVERLHDLPAGRLHPVELAALGRAVEKRRREFAGGRACAREALGGLGLPPLPVPAGPGGEPRWPTGVLGSITHCDGYRACAVARRGQVAGLGIDAEPNAALPAGVLEEIAGPEERSLLARLRREAPAVSWDRLLFSAKESVYKAWHPLTGQRLGFNDATVTVQRAAGTFRASLLAPGPVVEGRRLSAFTGRWLARDGLLLTAVALPSRQPALGSWWPP